MVDGRKTREVSEVGGAEGDGERPTPGLAVVFGGGRPATICVGLVDGAALLGRDHPAFAERADPRMSRRHVTVRRDRDGWIVVDHGSRNGAIVDGRPLAPGASARCARLLRIGDSLLVPLDDIGPLQRLGVRVAERRVEGPATTMALLAASGAARFGSTLHITGESGAGKEGLARAFHAAGAGGGGPLQAVNCAAIPEGVAERLLFGARRGAYSGADADADGYVQAAHGGTLFLDEVAELSLAVQAKLLRTLETGEVLPLGASKARRVELRFCSATHRDLRGLIAAGKFREDLFYRMATPTVMAPPLRERLEEVPWLLQMAIEGAAPGLGLHVSLVEACLLRRWPGNVRELLAEARSAAQRAVVAGAARVEARHLGADAGVAGESSEPTAAAATGAGGEPPTKRRLIGVLRRVRGNVSAAARELGVHRTQLRRWLVRRGIEASAYAPAGARDEPGE
jgi:hypothetical protein